MADLSMTNAGLTRELLQLERRYWKAIQDQDAETAMSLSDETCIIVGAQGVGKLTREALGGLMKPSKMICTIDAFELDERAQVTQLTEDVAILAYKVHEDVTVDGKKVSFDASDASTWVKRGGKWRCALHTESLVGDPFGRDRAPRPEPTLAKGLA